MKSGIVKAHKYYILKTSTSVTHFVIVHLFDQLGFSTKGIQTQSEGQFNPRKTHRHNLFPS